MRRARRFWLTETPGVIRGVENRQDAGSGCGNQKQGQTGFAGWQITEPEGCVFGQTVSPSTGHA